MSDSVMGTLRVGGRSPAPPTHRRADGSNSTTTKIHLELDIKRYYSEGKYLSEQTVYIKWWFVGGWGGGLQWFH